MALRMLIYMKTRDGSQNVGMPENKKWLSKCWVTREKEMALKTLVYKKKVMALPFVYMRTRDGSQNFGLHDYTRWHSKY